MVVGVRGWGGRGQGLVGVRGWWESGGGGSKGVVGVGC